jgi:hypothetical protein
METIRCYKPNDQEWDYKTGRWWWWWFSGISQHSWGEMKNCSIGLSHILCSEKTNKWTSCMFQCKNLIIQLLLGSLHLASDLHVMASGPWDRKTIKKPPCHNDRFSMIFSFLASHESHVATSSEFSRYQQINRQSLLWTFWTDFGMRSDLREKPSWAMFQARSSPWPNTKQRISDRIGQTKKCTITHLT